MKCFIPQVKINWWVFLLMQNSLCVRSMSTQTYHQPLSVLKEIPLKINLNALALPEHLTELQSFYHRPPAPASGTSSSPKAVTHEPTTSEPGLRHCCGTDWRHLEHTDTHTKSNAYPVKSLYFTSVNPHITSVVLYRWRVSHSDWRALSFPQPRLHHFLPPPASSGSDWRPGRQTCNPCTVNVKTHKEGRSRRPTTHKQVFSNFLC